ncbi:hypothetical protein [Candidatus Poriferisodalis sp.]|uniref:hypothetical protein n=1 Tax=Candidatus Poriferisodalis sp. TaxID=3101277 RepID=UPI003B520A90
MNTPDAARIAVAMASGTSTLEAARLAVRAGAWAVTVDGAQPSLPTMAQLQGAAPAGAPPHAAAQARP